MGQNPLFSPSSIAMGLDEVVTHDRRKLGSVTQGSLSVLCQTWAWSWLTAWEVKYGRWGLRESFVPR